MSDIKTFTSGRPNKPGVALHPRDYGERKCKCGAEFKKKAWNQKQCETCIAKKFTRTISNYP